jgi:beta-galactosidase/beta-glucuronidase
MARPNSTYTNLNGIWQLSVDNAEETDPPFNKVLAREVLVPFPVESCLSGVGENHQKMWYRTLFNAPKDSGSGQLVYLHFGAVDWQTTVFLNGKKLGNHTGGYDAFSFEISSVLQNTSNELLVFVFDPSDTGLQPFGKQRIDSILGPGGDMYTPSSGIWYG